MVDCRVAHKYWILDVVLIFFFPQNAFQGGGETIHK